MKNILSKISFRHPAPVRKPAILLVATLLAVTFWIVSGSSGWATPNVCTVCHKRTTTITLPCDSLDYQRHLDHGDPATACSASRAEIDREAK